VLRAWQGLGYNRRAVALHDSARHIVDEYGGRVPRQREALLSLPGVGPSTAAAVRAFAFDEADVLVETNIRRVFIHHFFPGQERVSDTELQPLVAGTLDVSNPRDWYYALMDYGVYLAGAVPNPNRRSAHYARRPSFQGSKRQLRGRILKSALAEGGITVLALSRMLAEEPSRIREAAACLEDEGLLTVRKGRITAG